MNIHTVKGEGMVVEDGRQVSFEYTLTVDKEVVDSTEGKNPLQYTHGKGKIIPGLARQLEGLRVGDKKVITVSPSEAYGNTNPEAFKEIAKASLPPKVEPKVGMHLQMATPQGNAFVVRISEIKDDTAILDLNHPLAGKTLTFDVKIVAVR
ncbi:MAG: peptidylprolyl isomerase [Deltaproteobacteria bacterium]|nr:peptidylprolyl isomerase [Deltaproteobacteria bacterium]